MESLLLLARDGGPGCGSSARPPAPRRWQQQQQPPSSTRPPARLGGESHGCCCCRLGSSAAAAAGCACVYEAPAPRLGRVHGRQQKPPTASGPVGPRARPGCPPPPSPPGFLPSSCCACSRAWRPGGKAGPSPGPRPGREGQDPLLSLSLSFSAWPATPLREARRTCLNLRPLLRSSSPGSRERARHDAAEAGLLLLRLRLLPPLLPVAIKVAAASRIPGEARRGERVSEARPGSWPSPKPPPARPGAILGWTRRGRPPPRLGWRPGERASDTPSPAQLGRRPPLPSQPGPPKAGWPVPQS